MIKNDKNNCECAFCSTMRENNITNESEKDYIDQVASAIIFTNAARNTANKNNIDKVRPDIVKAIAEYVKKEEDNIAEAENQPKQLPETRYADLIWEPIQQQLKPPVLH